MSRAQQRTVVITGAAGGLGRAFALGFAGRGYRVAVADLDEAGTAETARLVEQAGAPAWSGRVDVTSEQSAAELAEAVADFGDGRCQAVINNAAIYASLTRSPLEEISPTEWDQVMAVNLKGPWLVTKALSPYLEDDAAAIINIASATVYSGSEQWAHYVASKGGVIALTRVIAKELGRRGITANTIAPGFTLTEASYGLIDNAEDYGVSRGALRRPGQPGDIVGTALFLAGSDSRYLTGQTLVVDGGRQFI
ncbi:SDR family NAD(P)-dependent oxidoreductase [Gordonia sp. FQ]|uniref:SDR family NAD(P)-dependent oxidoreductase n=1 Tax=Gordonia sp. FQ TaxID=3446634 RepID=UPI003F84B4B4